MPAGMRNGRRSARKPVQPVAQTPAPVDDRPVIVAFGDSLTAGHGAVRAGATRTSSRRNWIAGLRTAS